MCTKRPPTTTDGGGLPTLDSRLLLENDYQCMVRRAHERLKSQNPSAPASGLADGQSRPAEVRRRQPFHLIMLLLRSHLMEPAKDAGLLTVLRDELGRPLWVEGE